MNSSEDGAARAEAYVLCPVFIFERCNRLLLKAIDDIANAEFLLSPDSGGGGSLGGGVGGTPRTGSAWRKQKSYKSALSARLPEDAKKKDSLRLWDKEFIKTVA